MGIRLSKVKQLALPFLANFVTSRRSCCLCEPWAISILLKRECWNSQKLSLPTMATEQLQGSMQRVRFMPSGVVYFLLIVLW